jgi:hypothetical protein
MKDCCSFKERLAAFEKENKELERAATTGHTAQIRNGIESVLYLQEFLPSTNFLRALKMDEPCDVTLTMLPCYTTKLFFKVRSSLKINH